MDVPFCARLDDGMQDLRYKPATGMHASSRQVLQTVCAEGHQIRGSCNPRAASQPQVPMCDIPLTDRAVAVQAFGAGDK